MRIGDTLRKAAGLLVEFPEDEHPAATVLPPDAPKTRTVEEIVRDTPGPSLEEIRVPQNVEAPSPTTDPATGFAKIYQQANLPVSPFTAEQVLELIGNLPAELPLETKRQTVKVTLNAMTKTLGVSPEMIVADASRKLAALAAFADHYAQQAKDFVQQGEADIASLQAQIEAKKQAIEGAKVQQTRIAQMCRDESDRLDDVLEFFSLDVPPSKYASPAEGQK